MILDNIDLSITKGEFIGIAGRSGSGKTTLIETIGGLHKPVNGSVFFEGKEINNKSFDNLTFRRKLQMVFQFPENQFFENTIYDEIAFSLRMLKLPENVVNSKIQLCLEKTGLSEETVNEKSPFTLSGGQKRRLSLACALATEPEILLLDEPFSGMDAEATEKIKKTLRKENENGTTIIMVSHDPEIMCELCKRIIVISQGKIIKEGKPEKVYGNSVDCKFLGIGTPDTVYASELIGLDLSDDLSYGSFIKNLLQKISGGDI